MIFHSTTAPEISEAFKGRRRVAPPPPEDFRHIEVSSMHAPVRRYPPLEPQMERGGRDRGGQRHTILKSGAQDGSVENARNKS